MNKFTTEQLAVLADLITRPDTAAARVWLYDHYRIQITARIHDQAEVLVPESVTAEDAAIIMTELVTLFR